ncbi:MAG: hypothetical protein Q4D25_06055 [Bacteroidales bacterium]|nr:hypothetical protein [Bacteroidales bacterium]
MKSLLSFFVPAAMMSLMVAGCSDYDNGYDSNAIKFAQEFRKTFGDIDPEQDWNLAERGTVTVSTMKESEVKIYALTGDEYTIVGDYQGVKGTQMLGFDMVEGTKSILVTDGVTAEKTVPGGVVTFGNTRFTVYEGTKEGVTVSRFTNETEINGKTYPAQKTPTEAEISTVLERVTERQPNLNKVTSNFQYVSTGSFVLYPYYWNTSSINTLGVYYTDANNQYHEVDIYTLNGENGYVENYGITKNGQQITGFNWNEQTNTDDSGNLYKRPNDWYIEGAGQNNSDNQYPLLHKNGWSTETDASELKVPFIQYWKAPGNELGTVTIKKDISQYAYTFEPNGQYLVEVKARLMNEGGLITNDNKGTITFKANNSSLVLTSDNVSTTTTYEGSKGVLYSDMNGTKKMWLSCNADDNGRIYLSFELNNVKCNWFAFKDVKVYDVSKMTKTGDNFYTSPERGKGIRVDIPEGTTFGMYLKKSDKNNDGTAVSPYTFYSESYKNDPNKVGSGVTVNADGQTMTQQSGTNPCYASTFKMPVTQDGDDEMFLGFEDWPNIYENSDFDLNDVVFAFDGCQPIIINEEADKWLLACEDLGGSFDIDYNDVVFSVEHISGQNKAKLTPLAAGGTLASYIYFQDPQGIGNRNKCFGEIHQLFGAEATESGEFEIVNARSRYEKIAPTIEFDVDENWTLAYYSTGETGGTNYGGAVNMGGFEIRTLKSGEDAPLTLDITSEKFSGASKIQPSTLDRGDNVPYILCLPYSYKHFNYNRATPEAGKKTVCVWAWPTELTTICNENGTSGPYKDFAGWVKDKNNNTDWYKNKDYQRADAATVENLYLSVSNMTQAEINANSGNGGNNGGNGGNNQKQPSPLTVNQQTVTWTVGQEFDMSSNITTSSNGAITYNKYHFAGGGGISEGDYDNGMNGNKLTPGLVGTHTISITQAETDEYYGGTVTYVLNVVNPSSNTGDWLSSTALTSYTLTVVPGSSNGTYTIKYGDDTVVVSNVTSIKLSVAELPKYATVTANNDGYSVQESVFTDDGTTGVIQITSADLANCLNGNGNLYVHENSGSIAFKLKVE